MVKCCDIGGQIYLVVFIKLCFVIRVVILGWYDLQFVLVFNDVLIVLMVIKLLVLMVLMIVLILILKQEYSVGLGFGILVGVWFSKICFGNFVIQLCIIVIGDCDINNVVIICLFCLKVNCVVLCCVFIIEVMWVLLILNSVLVV